jgi:hypothetical protein
VAGHRQCPATGSGGDLTRGLLAVVQLAARNHDVGTRSSQAAGDRAADTAAAAGHYRYAAGEIEESVRS